MTKCGLVMQSLLRTSSKLDAHKQETGGDDA
jgi:hypothetical protein